MATRRKATKQRIQPDYLPERDDAYLECGHDYFRDVPLARDDDLMRAVWEDHGREFLEKYVAQHPGRRPFAWWRFEAPEPRRRLGGTGTPISPQLFFGMPSVYGEDYDTANPPKFESQAAYLRRLHLLRPDELMDTADFKVDSV